TLMPRAFGDLTLNIRLRASPQHAGDLVTVTVAGATRTLSRVRSGAWMHFSMPFHLTEGETAEAVLSGAGNGRLEVDDLEVFPTQFPLVVAPGAKEYAPSDELVFERPLAAPPLAVSADGRGLSARLQHLLASRVATTSTTSFRRLTRVPVEALVGS